MNQGVNRAPGPFRRRFWPSRLNAPGVLGESLRIERVIAVARLLLTAIAFVAVDLNPVQPANYAPVAYALLIAFAAHSIAALIVLRTRRRTTTAFALTTHTVDLVAAAITLPMAEPNNSFFSFFLFVLAAAAFRWGFRETVATTVAAIVLVLLHARLGAMLPILSLYGNYQADLVVVRAAYLAMMGLLLGYLAEEGGLLRAENAAIVQLLGKIRVEGGLTRVFDGLAHETLVLFKASHLLIIIEELGTRRLFRWDTSGGWSIGPVIAMDEPPAADRQRYLFGPPQQTVAAIRRRWFGSSRSTYQITALNAAGHLVDSDKWKFPEAFLSAHPFRRLISAPVGLGDEWAGRVFIFNPKLDVRLIELAHFLQTLVNHVGPAVFNVYLLNRLRARAGAIERARVARELHDGVIQSLIGVEMQMEVLRSDQPFRETPAGAELSRLQGMVRTEVLNLRELMQQMRPLQFDPSELLDHLAELVDRFGRDTGTTARFSSHVKEVDLPPQVCFELVRIVQEALVNIRKHSAAKNVIVRFNAHDGFWSLEIDDDGRGFPFEGRRRMAELDALHSGPIIIKERVRAIGGQLAVDSTPGRGSKLEVLVPQEARG